MARKQLPFRIAPQFNERVIGDERLGELVFPVYGDLSVREQNFINENLVNTSTFMEIAKVSNKIARAEKIQPLAAHRFLSNVISSGLGVEADVTKKDEAMRIKYACEVERLSSHLLQQQWMRQVVMATALIRHRLEGMEDFSLEDAQDLSKDLVAQIYMFALEEETARMEPKTEEEEDANTEEALGK